MKKYQANDPQMTTFVFNDEDITKQIVYGLLSQGVSKLLGPVTVKPHPLIKQAVIAHCPAELAPVVQRFLDKVVKDYALTIAEKTLEYVDAHELYPSQRKREPMLLMWQKPRLYRSKPQLIR